MKNDKFRTIFKYKTLLKEKYKSLIWFYNFPKSPKSTM